MTKAVRENFRIILYLVAVGCLIWSGLTAYKSYSRDEVSPPLPDDTNSTPANTAGTATQANPSAPPSAPPSDALEPVRPPTRDLGKVMSYGGLAFLSLVGLSLLIARDASRYMAQRVDDFIFNDDLHGVHNPEYEEAERVWANGHHLDAIQLMRDYLKKHPREQYVALRIAEIYESNLGNYLAAALEYEEVLKKRLAPERWGWAAIHLANLYSGRLNKVQDASALLHRIVNEYGQTAAARKARERLGIPEPVEAKVAAPEPDAVASPPPVPAPPPSNLPPGFRPKG